MKLLFVADPLESFKTYKDSTFAMMREAARRGHELWACEPAGLVWRKGSRVVARAARAITLTDHEQDWFIVASQGELALADAGAVVMRKDPPFDMRIRRLHLHCSEQRRARRGALVVNRPASLARLHSEKLAFTA